jgi:uncharacterized YccA/Bax inhibitor family protein
LKQDSIVAIVAIVAFKAVAWFLKLRFTLQLFGSLGKVIRVKVCIFGAGVGAR